MPISDLQYIICHKLKRQFPKLLLPFVICDKKVKRVNLFFKTIKAMLRQKDECVKQSCYHIWRHTSETRYMTVEDVNMVSARQEC